MRTYPITGCGNRSTAPSVVTPALIWDRICQSSLTVFLFTLALISNITNTSAQCSLNCIQNVQVAIDQSGQALVTPNVVLAQYPIPGCNPNLILQIKDQSGQSFPTNLSCADLGKTFTVKVIDGSNGNFCNSSLTLVDQLKPQVNSFNLTVMCSDPTSPDLIGFPPATDNCTILGLSNFSFSDKLVDMDCKTMINGQNITAQILRTWVVTDKAGNSTSEVQTVSLRRAKLSDVVFPPDRDGTQAPKLDCQADPNNLKLTGVPTVKGNPIVNGANCELVVQRSDQAFNTCVNGSYSILRTWTIIDYCVDSFNVHVQVIRREDNKAPVMVAPSDITVGTLSNICSAIISLPGTTATDNCSNFNIKPNWQFGQGYGPFYNVPVGSHLVTYTATDDCGNTSTVGMKVTVIDDDLPVAVCKKDLTLTLDDDGLITTVASLFDDGSFDNCILQSIQVSRTGQALGSKLDFNCNDIGISPIQVLLRATDSANQTNSCNVSVTIIDPVPPTMVCPADVTISCTKNALDLTLTGQAAAFDNCQVAAVTFTDVKTLNSCNQGFISRKWKAIDKYNNFVECTQKITLRDESPLEITFPVDYSTNQCGANISAVITGQPSFKNNDCEQLDINFVDQYFNTAPPACFKIIRKWTVRDWCTFNPNIPGSGIWEKNQIIEVNDLVSPVLKVPSDITVGTTSPTSCTAQVTLSAATATDCNPNVSIVNNSGFAAFKNATASGTYPVGVHNISFTAYDGCGNASTASMKLTVVDTEPPIPACVSGLAIPLNSIGIANISVQMIEVGTIDNCTPKSSITYSLSQSQFNCTQLGNQTVMLTATDLSGNSNFCVTNINIQDNINYCASVVRIAGTVRTPLGEDMKEVEVLLNNNKSVVTGLDGKFEFTDLPKGANFWLNAKKENDILVGVSTLDVILITKHILGQKALDSPYKLIAADVNNNGAITAGDLVSLRKAILKLDAKFPNNTSWRFMDASHTYSDPKNPFKPNLPTTIAYDILNWDQMSTNFIGVKIGDVNLSVNPNNASASNEVRGNNTVSLWAEDRILHAGYEYEIPIFANDLDGIDGMQFTFTFESNMIEFQGLKGGEVMGMDETCINIDGASVGQVPFSWAQPFRANDNLEKPVFTLKLKPIQDVELSNVLNITSDLLEAQAYSTDEEIQKVDLRFRELNEGLYELHQNQPNPFRIQTNIPFSLKAPGEVKISIYNSMGIQVYTQKENYSQGYHTLNITNTDLNNQAGIYYYQLETDGKRKLTKKLVLLSED